MSRLLLVTVRLAGDAETSSHDEAWARVRSAVLGAGGRAWRFHSRSGPDRSLEFIEWMQPAGGPGLLEVATVADALAALDGTGPIENREIWEETP